MRNFKRNKHKKTFFIVMWQRTIEEYCCFTHFLLWRLINFNANLYCRRKIQNSSSANIIYLINKFNKSTHDKRKEFFMVWIAFVYSNVHRAPKLKDKKTQTNWMIREECFLFYPYCQHNIQYFGNNHELFTCDPFLQGYK